MSRTYIELLFNTGSFLVFPFWILMIFAPRWSWTARIIASPLIIAPPIVLYVTLAIPEAAVIIPAVVHPSVASMATLLASPLGATLGWLHFLAFDLFAGRWIYLDSRAKGMRALIVSPILVVTLMLGPLGFLIYICVRPAFRKDIPLAAAQ